MKPKRQVSANTLIKRRDAWLRKLADVGPIMRGSLVTARKGNHVAHQLTVSVKGKTHTVYVPRDMVEEVRQWTKNYRRMQRIVKEVSKLSMAIIHRHVPESRGDGRSTARRRPNPQN
jgi:hypothetical protein